jgi:hypothetical protein
MQSAEQSGIDEALSRPAQLATGATAWAGGLVLALMAGLHMQSVSTAHSVSPSPATPVESPTFCSAPSAESIEAEADDTLEPPAMFYPVDTIIAPRRARGVTQMQTR